MNEKKLPNFIDKSRIGSGSADRAIIRQSDDHIVDYVEKECATFSEKPLSQVDSLVLSWVSYLHIPKEFEAAYGWEGLRLVELYRADCFEELYGSLWDVPASAKLLAALAASPRFRDLRIMGYVANSDPEQQKQFAAMTLQLLPAMNYVAFRGTDSTFLGWKEDLNMGFTYPVPAQADAAKYLDEAHEHASGRFYVGGHSKGGNLAVYAAMHCSDSTRQRLIEVFSHDGPGFPPEAFEDGHFDAIRNLVRKTVPRSSIVGMLLETQEDYAIIDSSNFSVLQHDPFSWIVKDGKFVELESRTSGARYLDSTLNQWARSTTPEQREQITDALYAMVDSADAKGFQDLFDNWQTAIPKIMENFNNLDSETRDQLWKAIKELAILGGKQIAASD